MYCYPETKKVGSQVPINGIQVLGLKAILLTLGRIAGIASLHQASRAQMYYAVESPILLRREIPMAWGTTTDNLTPEINLSQYAIETKHLTLKDQTSYLIPDG